jgi:hypothetical protein
MLTSTATQQLTEQTTKRRQWTLLFGVLAGGIFLGIGSPLFAQERVVIERATGNVVDVGEASLRYDDRYFDHMDFPASPIPRGEDVRKYMRDGSGAIVLRPKDERLRSFADDRREDLTARIERLALPRELKAVLIDIVKGLRQ